MAIYYNGVGQASLLKKGFSKLGGGSLMNIGKIELNRTRQFLRIKKGDLPR